MPTETVTEYDKDGNRTGQSTFTYVEQPETVNRRDIRQKLSAALTVNETYQAIASPTAAQNLAQIRVLTKECNALIRLQMDLLADTTGT